MLYRLVLAVALLLSSANVASADWVWDCYQRVMATAGYGAVHSICKHENWEAELAHYTEYRQRAQQRSRDVERMQRDRRANFYR